MTRLTVYSILLLCTSCATIERPNAELCVVNAPAKHLKCYNLKEDYHTSGKLKSNRTAKYFRAHSVEDLNKGVWMSNDEWAKVKVWIGELRDAYEKEKLK